MVRRIHTNSTKGLEYHLPLTRKTRIWQWHRSALTTHLYTPHSIAAPFHPSPAPALQPQQPLHHPSASPCARRPPAPPAVLKRSSGLACAPRRVAFGETLGYGQGPGGCRYLLLELHTADYVLFSAFACCRCRFCARACAIVPRLQTKKSVHIEGWCADPLGS